MAEEEVLELTSSHGHIKPKATYGIIPTEK